MNNLREGVGGIVGPWIWVSPESNEIGGIVSFRDTRDFCPRSLSASLSRCLCVQERFFWLINSQRDFYYGVLYLTGVI